MACEELKSSKKWKELLQVILAVGNFINAKTSNVANTYGFKVKSLTKIKDTKTNDNKSNLLQYIVTYIDQTKNSLLSFMDELKNVDVATKVLFEAIDLEMAKVKKGKQLIQRELEQAKKANLENDKFIAHAEKFVEKHFGEIDKLEQNYQEMSDDLKEVAELYGEDANKLSKKPEEFFNDLKLFFADFQAAKQKLEDDKKKLQSTPKQSVTTPPSTPPPKTSIEDIQSPVSPEADHTEKLNMLLDPAAIMQRREAMKNKRKTQSKSYFSQSSIESLTLHF